MYTLVLGDNELDKGVYAVKDMDSGDVTELPAETFVEDFADMLILPMQDEIKAMLGLEEE